ncbi:MAG TPA: Crp/Fnr family transcriptional regulator [Candidatus Saccharimonadales bacterium]|nr:Crp/Fnr family transcriptional regulator [Candidatus Saccharimonadales bacterium]
MADIDSSDCAYDQMAFIKQDSKNEVDGIINVSMDIEAKVAAFFGQYPAQAYDKRALLLHAEEPIDSVFYIIEGWVSQYDIAPNGNEVVVNVFKPGAFFPMSSAINEVKNHYFFEASLKTKVHAAPKADVVHFLHENPDVLFDLLARVYRGVDGVLRRMAHLMGGDAQTRLIFELLNVTSRFGERQPNGTIHVHLTESDLAKHSGLARETVSRLLQGMKAAGLIETRRDGMLVKSTAELEAQLGTSL